MLKEKEIYNKNWIDLPDEEIINIMIENDQFTKEEFYSLSPLEQVGEIEAYKEMELETYWECLLEDLKNYDKKEKNTYLIILDAGLWDGRKIGYKIFNNLEDAVNSISSYNEEIESIKEINGTIEIKTCHHDGTNFYNIKPLSKILDTQ